MKPWHRGAAGALRLVIDDLQASLVEAPDAEVVEAARGAGIPGFGAAPVREVVRQALQVDWRAYKTLAPERGEGGRAQRGRVRGTEAPRVTPHPDALARVHPLPKRGEGK